MNLRIRSVARQSGFRGDVLSSTGVDPEEWDLAKYSDAAYAWMRKACMAQEDGDRKWRKLEQELWKGIEDPVRQKQAFDAAKAALQESGLFRG